MSFREQPTRFSRNDSKFRERYGDWAIVAGASEGLGAAWADALCDLHMNVLLIARRDKEMKALAQALESKYPGIQVDTLVLDLSDSDDTVDEVFATQVLGNKERKYGMLVYNAAHSLVGSFLDSPVEKQHLTVNVNVQSVLTVTHRFGNYLKSNRYTGGIILMSSLSGEVGTSFVSNYAGTKSWNTAFAHGLRYELAPLGIDVLACVAGPILTPSYIQAAKIRNPVIEQSPEQVVGECVQGIGAKSSIRTGVMNKLVRFFIVRLLPLELATHMFNSESERMLNTNLSK
jgi:uncharacterized protein